MARMKTFFIYFLLVVAFFIFSRVMSYLYINSMYKDIEIKNNTSISMETELKATSINGVFKYTIKEDIEKSDGQYIKLDCYSKNNVLMGTKYIDVNTIKTNEEAEIRFNFSKVYRAEISIININDSVEEIREEEKTSDPEMGIASAISAIILLSII